MKWIFKAGDHLVFDNSKEKAFLSFAQKMRFSGEIGEDVLILEFNELYSVFTAYGKISNIEIDSLDESLEKQAYLITIQIFEVFKEAKQLDSYIYSFRRITHYSKPRRHFNRKYSRMYKAEFDAVVQDKIYIKRTIFGTIVNSLPIEHRKAFVQYLATENPEAIIGKPDLDRSLDLLMKYLDYAVIQPSKLLQECGNLINELFDANTYTQIGFQEESDTPDSTKIQMLAAQVSIIDKYLNVESNPFQAAFDIASSNNDDNRFKSVFKNRPLPFDLK